MDDILERLREKEYACCGADYEPDAYCNACVLHVEAANQIERLTRERNRWQATAAGLSEDLSNAEDEIKWLRQGIWDACRILGMETNGQDVPYPLIYPYLPNLIVREAKRTTVDNQEEIERLQAIEDDKDTEIQRLRAENEQLRIKISQSQHQPSFISQSQYQPIFSKKEYLPCSPTNKHTVVCKCDGRGILPRYTGAASYITKLCDCFLCEQKLDNK